jgi:hypothetical protein
MGRQIFVADCIGCAPKASAGKAEQTARRVEYGQKKNPPGWVASLRSAQRCELVLRVALIAP